MAKARAMTEPTHIRWVPPALDSRTRPTHVEFPRAPLPDPELLIDGRYLSEMERRIMQGGYDCRGRYRLAPPRPPSKREVDAAWARTSATCARSTNALQCARCVYADQCAHRVGWPDAPRVERAFVPGGTPGAD